MNKLRVKEDRLQEAINNENIQAFEIDSDLITGYKGFYNQVVKRVIDFMLAVVITIGMSPILLIVAIAIFIEDGLPIFYRAERGGYHGESFRIYKFRSMVKNADKIGGGTTKLHDERITKIGKIIRKIKLDELANLFCVLNGTMSFVGPRPELLCYTKEYKGTEKKIFEVRPGMTDYSSLEFIDLDEIVGTGDADKVYEKYILPRKNKLRIKYAATVSFTTDFKLFFLTFGKVLGKAYGFIVRKEHR